jgi:hypothetical protein
MARRKRVEWEYGAVFAVPLIDGSYGIGQAIGSMMTNIVHSAFFSTRFQSLPSSLPALRRDDVVALLSTWKQSLNFGEWPILGVARFIVEASEFPNERFRDAGYVGATHYDEGIVQEFLSAYHGLTPWNTSYDERYYDALLREGVARPTAAIILPAEARQKYRVEKGWVK